jgi:glycosyltransferase involved in cell wall biosynthesis
MSLDFSDQEIADAELIKILDSYDSEVHEFGDMSFFNQSTAPPTLLFSTNQHLLTQYSILLPTYQRPKYIRQTLYTILHQDFTDNFELIIANNDIDDDCTDIIAYLKENSRNNIKISVYRNSKNLGMFGSSNLLASLASGSWITFVHDDDFLSLNFLSRVDSFTSEKIGVIIPHTVFMVDPSNSIYQYSLISKLKNAYAKIFSKLLASSYYHTAGAFLRFSVMMPTNKLYKKDCFVQAGGFDEHIVGDTSFNMYKFNTHYPQLYIADNLYYYRVWDNTTARAGHGMTILYAKVIFNLLHSTKIHLSSSNRRVFEFELNSQMRLLQQRFSAEVLTHFGLPLTSKKSILNWLCYNIYWARLTLFRVNFLFVSPPSESEQEYINRITNQANTD